MEQIKQHITVATGVIVYNEKNEILLGRMPKWEGVWAIVGGGVEWGESTCDGARREVKEETGLDIADVELLNVRECIFPPQYYKKKHFIFFDYCAKALPGQEVQMNDEFTEHAMGPCS